MHHTSPTVFAHKSTNLRAEWLDIEKSKE